MSQPLLAGYRITIPYTPSPLTHKFRAYCKPVASGAQPWLLQTFSGANAITWVASAQALWTALRSIFPVAATAPTATLEQIVAGLWQPIDFTLLTGAGTAGASNPAQQWTLTLRDTAFKKLKVVLLEGDFPYLGHSATGLGIDATSDTLVPSWSNVADGESQPVHWQVSRGNRFLLRAGTVAGLTYGLNKRLKRARHAE